VPSLNSASISEKVLTTATGIGESKSHLCLPTGFVCSLVFAYENNFRLSTAVGHFDSWRASANAANKPFARNRVATANHFTRDARSASAFDRATSR
jgi:hypothetical protein